MQRLAIAITGAAHRLRHLSAYKHSALPPAVTPTSHLSEAGVKRFVIAVAGAAHRLRHLPACGQDLIQKLHVGQRRHRT